MAFEHKPGQGALFRNERKKTDKHPDYTGSIKLPDGTECWFSGWLKDGGKGKFLSVSIGDPKDGPKQQGGYSGNKDLPPAGGPDLDDDIPFLPLRDMP